MTDEVLYRNKQWQVIQDFLECTENGYWIDWARLGSRIEGGDYEWHHHMCGKRWVDFDAFCDAWRAAARFAGLTVSVDALDKTERECREYLEDWAEYERMSPLRSRGNDGVVKLSDLSLRAVEFYKWRQDKRSVP